MKGKEGKEKPTNYNPNVLRDIPDWQEYFLRQQPVLEKECVVTAKGGTVDSLMAVDGLKPIPHPVTISATERLNAPEIVQAFSRHSTYEKTLGALYTWSAQQAQHVPWAQVRVKYAGRISSFDSGEEQEPHFTAGIYYDYQILQAANYLLVSQGTDSLVKKAALEAILFSNQLTALKKKVVIAGASKPGTDEGTDAIYNLNAGPYALLESSLPAGAYIVSESVTKDGDIVTHILPALGAVKLHSDGHFYSPNSGPILEIKGGTVYIHPLYYLLKNRERYFSLFPDFSNKYLSSHSGLLRLQGALEKTCIETVENNPAVLEKQYESGSRVFVIKARGVGNGPPAWKAAIKNLLSKSDTTVIIITLADSGDINLKKYAAGLHVPGVLSGRTLREETAWALGAIIHDLKNNNELGIDPQKLIELFCYLSGMIELPQEAIDADNSILSQ